MPSAMKKLALAWLSYSGGRNAYKEVMEANQRVRDYYRAEPGSCSPQAHQWTERRIWNTQSTFMVATTIGLGIAYCTRNPHAILFRYEGVLTICMNVCTPL